MVSHRIVLQYKALVQKCNKNTMRNNEDEYANSGKPQMNVNFAGNGLTHFDGDAC